MSRENFGTLDIFNIQECLDGYKKVLEWMPTLGPEEEILKDEKLKIIYYLDNKCNMVLDSLKEEG